MGPEVGRRVVLNVAALDEPPHERQALAQGGYCDVSAIFAVLLRQRGDQVIEDEFQLRARIFCRKVCQLLETGVAQASWIAQERHAGRDGWRHLLTRFQCSGAASRWP